jgi:hypothetical protein
MYGVQVDANDLPGALATARTVVAMSRRLDGADHPRTLAAEHALAATMDALGDSDGAAPVWARVLAEYERLYGPDSLRVMQALRDRALAESPGGVRTRPEAVAAITRAASIADRTLAANSAERAAVLESYAYVIGATHDRPAERAAYDRAIAAFETIDDPLGLARVLLAAAEPLANEGDCEHAVPLLVRAAKVVAATGQKTRVGAGALGALGQCLGAARRWVEAQAALEEAIAELDAMDAGVFAAQWRWELAIQLVHRGERARGLELARATTAQLADKPPPADELRVQIVAWLAKQ